MTHYFERKPDAPSRKRQFNAIVEGHEFSFETDTNIFSPDKIDMGSRLLAVTATPKKKDRVLDLGCGWGFVGIVLAKRIPDIELTLVDINERAVACATKNTRNNRVSATVLQSDGFSSLTNQVFDLVVFNPPFSAGKKVWQELVRQARDHLVPGGKIVLVGRHSKGGRDMQQFLEDLFGNVEILARESGYRIYASTRS